MAILKCKICGGDMTVSADKTFGTCEYCGSTMTLPKIDDEQRADAFNRGNHFRRIGEFDKALSVYERIVEENPNDAEAHWCCALCRFGIEWVEDPVTMEYLPTCHRASFDIFTNDVDYLAAVELSSGITQKQYKRDAAKISEVQKGILATSQNEKPFDVFICYKESDENGNRTVDSTLAQDIYYQLTEQGLRVFFARITLEDKVGSEYEPYIFAALNSAKVMVAIGTKPENFNAVWVKNEWSRFLSIVKHDRSKVLLPCYKDMDPYDLPEQLSVLQSYDMSKIGFIQDLIRGIEKITNAKEKKVTTIPIAQTNTSTNITPLLERAFMFLEDGSFNEADSYFEKVLDSDPKNANAYLGKLMAELHINKKEKLANCAEPFDKNNHYSKILRFGDEKLITELKEYIFQINQRNEKARIQEIYDSAVNAMKVASTADQYNSVIERLKEISGYSNSDELTTSCKRRIEEINIKEEQERLEYERKAEEKRVAKEKRKRRNKRIIAITTPVIAICIVFTVLLVTVIIPNNKYNSAMSLYNAKNYEDAYKAFSALNYKGSLEKAAECLYLDQRIALKNISVGSEIKFGCYEQDNDLNNGKGEIQWIVLDVKDNRALIISKYALDCQCYNDTYIGVTWQTCSLRTWLNETFYNSAFEEVHKEIIQTTTVTADKNPSYTTPPGNYTEDKIFLLSITEANKYFNSNDERSCRPTVYAKSQGAYTNINNLNSWVWLRSPGDHSDSAAIVDSTGFVKCAGNYVNANGAVRPAMWISLE